MISDREALQGGSDDRGMRSGMSNTFLGGSSNEYRSNRRAHVEVEYILGQEEARLTTRKETVAKEHEGRE